MAPLRRAAERIEAHLGPLLPLLSTLSLVQGLLWAWATFGIAAHRIAPTRALTLRGAGLYQPDHDLPIYVAGTLSCILLDGLLLAWLSRAPRRAGSPRTALSDLATCAAIILLPSIAPESETGWLVACAIGACLVVRRMHTWGRWPSPGGPATVAPPPGATAAPSSPLEFLAPAALLAALVYIPWTAPLLRQAYAQDHFHHLDFYVMAPALAHAHGLRLGTDFYTQYGVGWPMVLDGWGRLTGARGYTAFIRLEVLAGCAYFLALFGFLRSWLRSGGWAMTGLLLSLSLALFAGTGDGAKWLWPSSTVMRYAFDVALFAVLLAHARSGDARLGPLAGGVLALQLLFSSDVGLYLTLAFAVYLVCALRRPADDRPARALGRFAIGAAGGWLIVAGIGFTLANQGELPGPAFWRGLMESIVAYGGGIGNLPIASAIIGDDGTALLLLAMLVTYLRSVSTALRACLARRVTASGALRAAIAVYGLGTMMLFIGRSHGYNLTHVCIPFCLLATETAMAAARAALATAAPSMVRLPHALSLALLATVCVQASQIHYPSLLAAAIGAAKTRPAGSTYTDAAGDALPAVPSERLAGFRTASEAIRHASDGGRQTVAVLGYDDTASLLEAGVEPYFRYSPVLMNLLFKDQVDDVARRIQTAPPDWIFIAQAPETAMATASSQDAVDTILARMRPLYALQGSAGRYAVYRKTLRVP